METLALGRGAAEGGIDERDAIFGFIPLGLERFGVVECGGVNFNGEAGEEVIMAGSICDIEVAIVGITQLGLERVGVESV